MTLDQRSDNIFDKEIQYLNLNKILSFSFIYLTYVSKAQNSTNILTLGYTI